MRCVIELAFYLILLNFFASHPHSVIPCSTMLRTQYTEREREKTFSWVLSSFACDRQRWYDTHTISNRLIEIVHDVVSYVRFGENRCNMCIELPERILNTGFCFLFYCVDFNLVCHLAAVSFFLFVYHSVFLFYFFFDLGLASRSSKKPFVFVAFQIKIYTDLFGACVCVCVFRSNLK